MNISLRGYMCYIRPMATRLLAVITGDVAGSTAVRNRVLLNKALKEAFATVSKKGFGQVRPFEIYRGDSFQGVFEPAHALRAALAIRARLRQGEAPVPKAASKGAAKRPARGFVPLGSLPDARISIGIGTVSFRSAKVIESDGEAFRASGRELDALARAGGRLAITTPWEEVDKEFAAMAKLLDALVSNWSSASAQAMFLNLSQSRTQTQVSIKLGISQPAVHKRLANAGLDAVNAALQRYEDIMAQHVG